MKCKYCFEIIPNTVPPQKRCPSCGASVMEKQTPKIPVLIWLFAGLFLFTGVLITFSAIVDGIAYYSERDYYVQVDATIVEIRQEITPDHASGEEDVDHTVYVSYTWGGRDYGHMELGHYDTRMKTGDIIQVEIDSRSPGEIVSNELWLVLVGIPVTALGVAVLQIFRKQFTSRNQRRLTVEF